MQISTQDFRRKSNVRAQNEHVGHVDAYVQEKNFINFQDIEKRRRDESRSRSRKNSRIKCDLSCMKRQVRSLDSVARFARCIDHYYFRTTCKLVCGTVRDDLWTDIVLQISSREYISSISESLVTGTILLQIRRCVFRERNENSILWMGLRSISSMVGFAAIRRRALSLQRVLRQISSCHFNPFVFPRRDRCVRIFSNPGQRFAGCVDSRGNRGEK